MRYNIHGKRWCSLQDTGHSFSAYYKRATSPLVVLSLLLERPMYGYELSAEMKERSGGLFKISVLYPVLYRLQELGYIEEAGTKITDGRARSYYQITPQGERYFTTTLAEYKKLAAVFEQFTEVRRDDGSCK